MYFLIIFRKKGFKMSDEIEIIEVQNSFYTDYKNNFNIIKIFDSKIISEKIEINTEIVFDQESIERNVFEDYINLLNFFFNKIINNSICIEKNNEILNFLIDRETCVRKINNNIILINDQPYDDHLLLYIHSKLGHLGNNILFFPYTMFKKENSNVNYSFLGDATIELPEMKEWIGENSYHDKPWWCRNDFSTIDLVKKENIDKVPDNLYNNDIFKNYIENFNENLLIKELFTNTEKNNINDEKQIMPNEKIINLPFKRKR